MSVPHVFLALPCYNAIEPHFMGSLLNVERRIASMAAPPFRTKIDLAIGDPTVGHARNLLAARFLQSECSHLLFLDTDLTFTFENIHTLLMAAAVEDPCIACGTYTMKTAVPRWTYESLGQEPETPRASGLTEVARAGTGFMLIAREVLEHLRDSVPALAYHQEPNEPGGWNFFHAHVNEERRYVHEDYAFCDLARAHGIPIFVHRQIVARHVGRAMYPLVSPSHNLPISASSC